MTKLKIALLSLMLAGAVQAESLHLTIVSTPQQREDLTSFSGIVVEERRALERAIKLALDEAKLKFDLYGIEPQLKTIEIDPAQPIEQQLSDLDANHLLLLDLPANLLKTAANYADKLGAVAINTSASEQSLRSDLCLPGVYHAIPSDRMYFDALAQFLVHSGWLKVLLVHGSSERDMERKTILAESIERFGGSISDERIFTLSHHPDDRDRNKPEFLTGRSSYDVVAVIDSELDFGRRIQFSTRRPRPVVGDVGLVPKAWHYALERYGAPQLNERYRNLGSAESSARLAMTDREFAAWASVKFVANSLNPTHLTGDGLNLRSLFEDKESRVDLYKGTRGSFRYWNHQMRQPILLATENYVSDIAPMPKFLHPTHYTDTLGEDQPESTCQHPLR